MNTLWEKVALVEIPLMKDINGHDINYQPVQPVIMAQPEITNALRQDHGEAVRVSAYRFYNDIDKEMN